jgi:16S rRNA (cytidine1402-2'-O)-methyltransferase
LTTDETGCLYLVATPIGNLDDLSARAVSTLDNVDLIAAEDTRRTSILLKRNSIKTPMMSFHDFNKEKRVPELIKKLGQGKNIALVTEAGSPGISDPGFYLAQKAASAGFDVISIPGPSAAICALQVSALPTDRFCFEGFLPRSAVRRRKTLESLADENRTMIFFESPKRLLPSLRQMKETFGDRYVAVCRELTKLHEEVIRGALADVISGLEARDVLKGEIVVVVSGARYWEKQQRKAARRA